jgi:excisionase family DNA binding protein
MPTCPVMARIVAGHRLPHAAGSPVQLDGARSNRSGMAFPVRLSAAAAVPAVSPRPNRMLRVVADQVPPLTLAEPLLTADQVSRLLGIPRSSVYEYARRAHDPLPAVRVGRHVRFHRSALERWLADLHG